MECLNKYNYNYVQPNRGKVYFIYGTSMFADSYLYKKNV